MRTLEKIGLGVASALLVTGCGHTEGEAGPPIRQIDPTVVGYTAEGGRAIAYQQFNLAKLALEKAGYSQVAKTSFAVLPPRQEFACGDDILTPDELNAEFMPDCNRVVITQRLIDNMDELIKPTKNAAVNRAMYPKLLRIVIGHEIGHAVLPLPDPHPETEAETRANIDIELHADCIGGQLLHETFPAEADWLLKRNLYNWVDIDNDTSTHGSAIERSFSEFAGIGGIDCLKNYAIKPSNHSEH